MSWLLVSLTYLSLLILSFLFNKRSSKLEIYLHNALYYVPFFLGLIVYFTIFIFMYLLHLLLTSRLFFHEVGLEDCPVGKENTISTILTPIDSIFQFYQDEMVTADGLFKLKGEFSYENFKSTLLDSFALAKDNNGRLLYPRLTQVVKKRSLFYIWEHFADFNINNHVTEKWIDLSNNDELISFLNSMHSKRLPHGLPGFQFMVLHDKNRSERPEDTITWVVYRLDHSMGDGITFVRIFMNSLGKPLTENDNSKLVEAFKKYDKSPYYRFSVWSLIFIAFLSPIYLADFLQLEPKGFFRRPLTGKNYISFVTDLDFKKVVAIKNKTKVSVNDVFLLLLTQALQSYMLEVGENPATFVWTSLVQAISLNVSLAGAMANNIVGVRIKIPLHIMSWRNQLKEINEAMLEYKYSPKLIFLTVFVSITSFMPRWIQIPLLRLVYLNTMTGSFSNVPGPDIRMSLAGTPISDYSVIIPKLPGMTISCGILTFGGKMSLNFSSDGAVCTNPDIITRHLARKLDDIYQEVTDAI